MWPLRFLFYPISRLRLRGRFQNQTNSNAGSESAHFERKRWGVEKSLLEKLSTKNILVIDDDGLITRTLCALLKNEGYFAAGSDDGFDAIDKTEETDFDLNIADIKMPEMDGVETIRKIKLQAKEKNKPEIPVIFKIINHK